MFLFILNNNTIRLVRLVIAKRIEDSQICNYDRANLHTVHIKLRALCFATFSAKCDHNNKL